MVRSSTSLAFVVPRIFMDDTEEDHKAIQPVISQVVYYPLSEFDGKMKTKDWSKLPHFPAPKTSGKGETKWVNPDTYFDELPAVMKQCRRCRARKPSTTGSAACWRQPPRTRKSCRR